MRIAARGLPPELIVKRPAAATAWDGRQAMPNIIPAAPAKHPATRAANVRLRAVNFTTEICQPLQGPTCPSAFGRRIRSKLQCKFGAWLQVACSTIAACDRFSGRPASCPCASPSGAFAAPQQIGPNQTSNLTIWRRFSPYAFHLDLAESVISNCPRCPSETIALLEGTANWRGEKDVMARKKMSWHEWRPM